MEDAGRPDGRGDGPDESAQREGSARPMAPTVDRYHLHLQVSAHGVVELWQAWDPSLERPVAVLLVPSDDPRARSVADAARRAATVDDRRLVGVLDVLERAPYVAQAGSRADEPPAQEVPEYLAVVTEWVEGRTLTDLLEEREGEPVPAGEALVLVRQVALAISSSHAQGVSHGRLRPDALLIADAGSPADPLSLFDDVDAVRIRGLAVDSALWPQLTPPSVDPDIHGIGSLLYAAVTGRWPEGLADGLSPAPRAGGRLLPPSQVVADVPASIDEICMRSIDPRIAGEGSERRFGAPYPDVATLAQALTRASASRPAGDSAGMLGALRRPAADAESAPGTSPAPSLGRRVARGAARLAIAAAALLAITGLATVGLRIAQSAPSPWGLTAAAQGSDVLTSDADTDLAAAALLEPGAVMGEIEPVKAIDHDPFGYDGEESPDLAELSIDNDATSAWTTDTYYSEDFDGKSGVGLIIDLGSAQSVSAVRLEMVGSGSSVKVLLSSTIIKKPAKWTLLAEAQGVGTAIDLRSPRPIVGRYVLIWFDGLPVQDGAYQGGLRDVVVLS